MDRERGQNYQWNHRQSQWRGLHPESGDIPGWGPGGDKRTGTNILVIPIYLREKEYREISYLT